MDLRLFEIFCAVYEERSFSRAAARLGLSQPTVSEHVQTLEKAFETLLFERMARDVRSTRAGDHLYEQARRVGELRRGIEEGMARFLKRLEGRLVIGASTIPGEYLLPPLIGGYRETHPGVRLSLAVRDSKGVLDDLEAARIDLGFVGVHPADGHLKSQKFASDRLVLIVPVTRRWKGVRSISLRELRKEPFLVRERGSGTRSALESRLKELGLALEDFNVVAELGSTTAIKEAVRARVGVSVISLIAVKGDLAADWVRELRVHEIGRLQRDFYRVFDARRTKSPLCDSFLEHLDQRLATDSRQTHRAADSPQVRAAGSRPDSPAPRPRRGSSRASSRPSSDTIRPADRTRDDR